MKKLLMYVLLLLSLDTFTLYADTSLSLTPNDFQYCTVLEGLLNKNVIYRTHLSPNMLKKCSPDYRDIRLFSPDNKEIPFVIIENEYPKELIESYSLEVVDYSDTTTSAIIIVKLPEKYRPISLIDLNIADRDFKKDVTLYGSHDRKKWNLLAKEIIYDFSSQVDMRKTSINFEKADYRFYRIELINIGTIRNSKSIKLKYEGLDFSANDMHDKKLRINKIIGQTDSMKDRAVIYDEMKFTGFHVVLDKNRNTVIILEAALPSDLIYFDISNPYYYRTVLIYFSDSGKEDSYRLLTQGSIYSFPLSGVTETKNYIAYRSNKHRYYKFIIDNKNNPPLEIESIKFKWVQKNLYFVAINDSAQYSLCLGNNIINKPDYDLSSFVNQGNWFMQKHTILNTTPIKQNVDYKPKTPQDKKAKIEKAILIAIVIILVIGIGFWLYKLLGKTSTTSRD